MGVMFRCWEVREDHRATLGCLLPRGNQETQTQACAISIRAFSVEMQCVEWRRSGFWAWLSESLSWLGHSLAVWLSLCLSFLLWKRGMVISFNLLHFFSHSLPLLHSTDLHLSATLSQCPFWILAFILFPPTALGYTLSDLLGLNWEVLGSYIRGKRSSADVT